MANGPPVDVKFPSFRVIVSGKAQITADAPFIVVERAVEDQERKSTAARGQAKIEKETNERRARIAEEKSQKDKEKKGK